jgi:glycine hydroxymethyltransferase
MDEPEMKEVASIIGEVLRHGGDEDVEQQARTRVRELTSKFPVYAG